MKDFSVKKLILCSYLFLISLFTLLALCFHLVNINMLGQGIGESGFSLFDFSSIMIEYQGMVVPFGIVCIIQLVVSIIMLAFSIYIFFRSPKEKYKKTGKTIITWGIVLCSVYLAMGIASAIVVRVSIGSNIDTVPMTFAFLPLLFVILLAVAYKVTNKMMAEDFTINSLVSETKTECEQDKSSEMQQIKMLKEYGELLDKGYITKEEFDAKKAKILSSETETKAD